MRHSSARPIARTIDTSDPTSHHSRSASVVDRGADIEILAEGIWIEGLIKHLIAALPVERRALAGGGGAVLKRVRGVVEAAWPVQLRFAGGGLELDPAVAGEIDLHPGVCVALRDLVLEHFVVVEAFRIAADHTRRYAEAAQHNGHGCGVVVAVALANVVQEILDGVAPFRRGLDGVIVFVAAQVNLQSTRLVVDGL